MKFSGACGREDLGGNHQESEDKSAGLASRSVGLAKPS